MDFLLHFVIIVKESGLEQPSRLARTQAIWLMSDLTPPLLLKPSLRGSSKTSNEGDDFKSEIYSNSHFEEAVNNHSCK